MAKRKRKTNRETPSAAEKWLGGDDEIAAQPAVEPDETDEEETAPLPEADGEIDGDDDPGEPGEPVDEAGESEIETEDEAESVEDADEEIAGETTEEAEGDASSGFGESDVDESGAEESAEEEEESGDGEDQDDESDGDVEADDDESGDDEADDGSGGSGLPTASVVEAVLFAAREPLKLAQIARAVGKRTRQDVVRQAIEELNVHYLETSRSFEVAEISGKYQLMSRPEYADHIMRIYPKRELTDKDAKSQRLTPAMLDTLAIVAYKQPVMRSEIDRIRGVSCANALRALIERGSVKEVGRRTDLVGKPGVFGTTERFLAEFGLGSLDELPMRHEFVDPGAPPPLELDAAVDVSPDVSADVSEDGEEEEAVPETGGGEEGLSFTLVSPDDDEDVSDDPEDNAEDLEEEEDDDDEDSSDDENGEEDAT